jgi:selenocysteine lyase/cysteine desulfurase
MRTTTRRAFLGAVPAAALAPTLSVRAAPRAIDLAMLAAHPGPPEDVARDEDFWEEIARGFTVDRTIVNLNNGGVSPSPAIVQEAMKRHLDFSNATPPPIALWEILEPRKEAVRAALARHWGADREEIAITRNASESLQICQLGIDLEPGDEVLTTDQDYPRMRTAFRQRERREGIVLRELELPVMCTDDEEVVRLFRASVTPRTRLILMCHMVNLTGQILPVAKVAAMARSVNGGVPLIVDGAHALAHVPFRLPELGCDYYGASLHKWLFAPHGTGLLYVRRDRIAGLWPLMAAEEKETADVRKLEEIGTHPAANALAIAEALAFHQAIGDERKAARLRFLRDRWARRLLALGDRVRLHTNLDARFSCGIATVQIDGIDSTALGAWLRRAKGILVTPIVHARFEGLRVSPSVYTTPIEIDLFAEAMEEAIRDGIEAE